MSCKLVYIYRRFEKAFYHHIQGLSSLNLFPECLQPENRARKFLLYVSAELTIERAAQCTKLEQSFAHP